MPLDLVGKLHRTVYITHCPDGSEEDLLQLMRRRCGAIEAWDVVEDRLIVVFQSMNSISTATAFNGMAFVDLTKHLVVWCARDPPPKEAPQQLAISGSTSAAETREEDPDEAKEKARAERQQKQSLIQDLLGKEAERLALGAAENRDAKMRELCYRQLKALCVLTEDAVRNRQRELQVKKEQLEMTQGVLEGKGASTAGVFKRDRANTPPADAADVKHHRTDV